MEQRKRGFFGRFRSLRLSHKTILSLGLLILCSNLLVLLLITHSSTRTLQQNAYEQLQGQLSIALSTVDRAVDDISDLMISLSTTQDMRTYAGLAGRDCPLDTLNGVNESLRFLVRASNLVDFAALLQLSGTDYLYAGETIPEYEIRDDILSGYRQSETLPNSSIRTSLLLDCYPEQKLVLYIPVCITSRTLRDPPSAVLAVGIGAERMVHYLDSPDGNLNLRLLDTRGRVLASSNPEEIGTRESQFDSYAGTCGQLRSGENLLVYQRLSQGFLTADSTISRHVLFAEVYRTTRFIVLVILFFTLLALAVGAAFCKRFYAPMQDLTDAMERVEKGDLALRLPPWPEKDFRQLSRGLNRMLDSISFYIQEIKRKERENTEIRLNALQSQIKPHFLYNALDSIHWQALIAGDTQVSEMVLALSRFYRLCLSKGQDVVPLSQELEHTRSYVQIQNMRFDDIVTLEFRIPENLMDLLLPKITLQPLVENSIYHGFKAEDGRKGHILIRTVQLPEDILLLVEDDGIGMPPEEMEHLNRTMDVLVNDGSYGIKNVHQRLSIRYGPGYGLSCSTNEAGGVTVTIRLPGDDRSKEGT